MLGRRDLADDRPPIDAAYGGPVRLAALVTVLTYVLAGVAKLRLGGLEWMLGDTLRNHVAYSAARLDLLGGTPSPLGRRLVAQAWLFPPLAIATVLVELGRARRAARRPGAQRLGRGGLAPARRRRRADVRRLPLPAVPGGVRAVLPPRAADRRPPLLEPEGSPDTRPAARPSTC